VAGYLSPLLLLGLGAGSERAGFRSPLPLPPFGADAEGVAGYATPLPIYFGYAGEPAVPPEPPPTFLGRGGPFIDREPEKKRSRKDDILFMTPHGV